MRSPVVIIVIAVLLSVLATRFLAPAPSTTAQTETAYERIMRTGTIRCGYVLYPSYVEKDPNTGAFSGISYAIANEMARRLSLKIDWREEVGWANFIEGLRANRYDMVCSGGWQSATEGRFIAYSPPIYYAALNVWVRADDTRFDADHDTLNSPEVTFIATDGGLTGTLVQEYFPKARIISLPNLTDFATLYENVHTGKADAVLAENQEIQRYLNAHPGVFKNLTAAEPLRVFPVSPLILPVADATLKNMVDTAITEMQHSGFIDRVLAQYNFRPQDGLRPAKPYVVQP